MLDALSIVSAGDAWSHPLQSACSQTPVSAIMSGKVVCVRPDMSVEGVTALLLERSLTAVAVIDRDGALLGIVSTTDLLREVQDRGDVAERDEVDLGDGFHQFSIARATVEEIMTPFAFTILDTASVAQAAALMSFEGISQLPVVASSDRRIVALLSALDIMRWLGRLGGWAADFVLTLPTVRADPGGSS